MNFACNTGATIEQVEMAERAMGLKFPADYVNFLKNCNGGEGFVGERYLILWKVEELDIFNRDYGGIHA